MRVIQTALCIAVVSLTAGVARAADGVLLVQKMTSGGSTSTNQIQIESNRMRAEIADASGRKMTTIFDAGKQVIMIVDDGRKTYSEMTKADIDRLGGQMQDMMAQMQAAMASMPPGQRAQMEAMMRGRGMGAMGGAMAAPKTEYRKTGTDRVGKWACDKYEGTQNGQKTTELCTVEPSALGLTAADMNVMTQLAAFFKQLIQVIPGGADVLQVGGTQAGFSGVPVRTVTTSGVTVEITDVSRQTFADSLFQPPAGYTKQDLMGGMGRGRQ